MPKQKKLEPGPIAATLRKAYRDSGLSLKALSEQSDVPYAAVHGFFTGGQRDIYLSTIERLAGVLNLELVQRKRKRS